MLLQKPIILFFDFSFQVWAAGNELAKTPSKLVLYSTESQNYLDLVVAAVLADPLEGSLNMCHKSHDFPPIKGIYTFNQCLITNLDEFVMQPCE